MYTGFDKCNLTQNQHKTSSIRKFIQREKVEISNANYYV